MAVYDDEKTRPDPSDDDLRRMTGIGPEEERGMESRASQGAASDIAQQEGLSRPLRDEQEDNVDKSKESSSPGALNDAEKNSGGSRTPSGKNDESSFDYHNEGGRSRKQRVLSGALFGIGSAGSGKSGRSMSKAKKTLLFGAAIGGGGGALVVLIALLFIASSLKIPHLAQNIVEYQFARLTRQTTETNARVVDENMAVDASSDSLYSKLKNQYANATGKVSDTWSKLDKFRPSKAFDNFYTSDDFKLNYEPTGFLGRNRLASVTIKGVEYKFEQPTGFIQNLPGIKQYVSAKQQADFVAESGPALTDALREYTAGPIIRGIVAQKVRNALGIGLSGLALSKFKGETSDEARVTAAQQQGETIDENTKTTPDTSASDADSEAVSSAKSAEETALQSDSAVKDAINNQGIIKSVQDAIGSAVAKTPLKTVVGAVSPFYNVALPICLVYDGSLDNSGSTIDNQTAQQQATFYYVGSVADQQKNGTPINGDGSQAVELATAIGAANNNIGNIDQSNPIMRSDGATVDTSSNSISSEASADGEFTLLNASGIPQSAANTINSVAVPLCKTLTNIWLAAGVGLAQLIVQFVPGIDIGADTTDAAGEAAAQSVTKIIINRIAEKIPGEWATKTVNSRFFNLIGDTVSSTTKLVAATVFAKLIVLARANQVNSGLAQGSDIANAADSGGNIQANELERAQNFGRPLLQSEVCASNQQDTKYILAQESSKSAFQRYLAVSNANSLLSRAATTVSANFQGSLPELIMHMGSMLFKPTELVSPLARLFSGRAAAASCPNDNANEYGNVQFGWSQAEENLIDSSTSYSPLENQQTLDNAPQIDGQNAEDYIAQKYAICFGYTADSNGSLTLADGPGQPASIGTLLSKGDIIRDSNGNVINDPNALCSPVNLGINNPQYGDLVFRWRIAEQYNNSLDQLNAFSNLAT